MTNKNEELARAAADFQAALGMTDEQMADGLSIDITRYKNLAAARGDEWTLSEAIALAGMAGCSLDELAGMGRGDLPADSFHGALVKVKFSASSITAICEVNETVGRLKYEPEVLEVLETLLHEAARALDSLEGRFA